MKEYFILIIVMSSCNFVAQKVDGTPAKDLNSSQKRTTEVRKTKLFKRVDYEKRNTNCLDLDGQQDINSCLSVIMEEHEAIMQAKLECITLYFDNKIAEYSSDKNSSDIVKDLTRQKQSLITSQECWQKMHEANSAYWAIGGGSISEQYLAENSIKDLQERIVFLDCVISEESQGTNGADCIE